MSFSTLIDLPLDIISKRMNILSKSTEPKVSSVNEFHTICDGRFFMFCRINSLSNIEVFVISHSVHYCSCILVHSLYFYSSRSIVFLFMAIVFEPFILLAVNIISRLWYPIGLIDKY